MRGVGLLERRDLVQYGRVLEVGLDPRGERRGGHRDAVDDRVLEGVALGLQDVGLVRVQLNPSLNPNLNPNLNPSP